jgi:hypothetical protein
VNTLVTIFGASHVRFYGWSSKRAKSLKEEEACLGFSWATAGTRSLRSLSNNNKYLNTP